MNPQQRIAAICRKLNIEFTLGQLDDLVKLCEEFHFQLRNEENETDLHRVSN
jgi:hypothetical protein